ncbi:MAG: hypothetical protein NVSMB32_10760 [Actinomycetota bacterium]
MVGLERHEATGRSEQQVVALDGSPGADPVGLPTDYEVIGQVSSGYLLWHATGVGYLQVWLPPAPAAGTKAPGRFVRSLGVASAVIGLHADSVAWLATDGCESAGECPLHITDAFSGVDQTVAPPPGRAGYLAGGGFSPDGGTLAAFVADPLGAHLTLVRPDASKPASAVAGFTARRIDGGLVQTESPAATAVWTPDGTRVFFCGVNGTMHVLRIGDAAASSIDQPSSSSFAVF